MSHNLSTSRNLKLSRHGTFIVRIGKKSDYYRINPLLQAVGDRFQHKCYHLGTAPLFRPQFEKIDRFLWWKFFFFSFFLCEGRRSFKNQSSLLEFQGESVLCVCVEIDFKLFTSQVAFELPFFLFLWYDWKLTISCV